MTVRHKSGFIPTGAMAESRILGAYSVTVIIFKRWLSIEKISEYVGFGRDMAYAWLGKRACWLTK